MKTTVSFFDFCNAFRSTKERDSFSDDGKRALFDYLEEVEDRAGEQIELNVIELCREYSEDHWADLADHYQIDLSDCSDDDECMAAVGEYLDSRNILITGLDNGLFVYRIF